MTRANGDFTTQQDEDFRRASRRRLLIELGLIGLLQLFVVMFWLVIFCRQWLPDRAFLASLVVANGVPLISLGFFEGCSLFANRLNPRLNSRVVHKSRVTTLAVVGILVLAENWAGWYVEYAPGYGVGHGIAFPISIHSFWVASALAVVAGITLCILGLLGQRAR